MADEAYYLTKRDRDLLDKMHASWSHMFQSSNSPRLDQFDYDNPPQAPECYIALVPEAGIPAATPGTGTGGLTFQVGDRPGSAECDLYAVVDGELQQMNGSKKVYNLTEEAIPQGWISIKRDKWGTWLADTGGGTPEECQPRSEVWQIHMIDQPASGSFDIIFAVDSGETPEGVTIDFDSTDTDAQTAFEGHTEVGSGNVVVGGGPLPDTNLIVRFQGALADIPIGGATQFPTIDKSALLDAGSTGIGLGAVITIPRRGFVGNP